MNKKVIGVLVLVVALGVIGFIFKDKIFKTNSKKVQVETSSPKTLKDLLNMGVAQKCTYEGGTVYVSGSKFRGDFESISQENVKFVPKKIDTIWKNRSC